jgi:hypothetical protein
MTQRISPKDLQTYRNKVRGGVGGGAKQQRNSPPAGNSRKSDGPTPSPLHYDSQDEATRHTYWVRRMLDDADDVLQVTYHPFTVGLTIGLTYEPDFLIQYRSGDIEVEEFKASKYQKNIRETVVKLKMAAAKLPMFDWYLCVGSRRRLIRG